MIATRKLNYCQAINEALTQEMERDPAVFVYGIGVPDHKRIFGTTAGLVEKFGPQRCFDTPLSEDAMSGFGLGAAINGLRPVHIHARVDFLLLCMNQLANMIASCRYSSGGKLDVPMVIRAIIGRGWGQTFQHSKSVHSIFAHIPGLKVVMPTTPVDAKGLLISAIRDNDPVVFVEHRWLYYAVEEVPEEPVSIPLGKARVLRPGDDITVVALSWMGVEALKAADTLKAKQGVTIEVVDPRTINPLDIDLIVNSVNKTGHCIVADNDWLPYGCSAEIAAEVSEACFGRIQSPVKRIGFAFTHCPSARHLEDRFYPNAADIVRAVEAKLGLDPTDMTDEELYSYEHRFKGPF